jgi:hypothetical protein
MPSAVKIDLKHFLQETAVPDLTREASYFSLNSLKTYLVKHRWDVPSPTLKRYLHDLTRKGLIYSAGRGWYSTVAKSLQLDTGPVVALTDTIEEQFPLLDFSAWSTEQVAAYGHHLAGKFVGFIHVERESMGSVCDHLRNTGWNAYLNPTKLDAKKYFGLEDSTVVVRPNVTETPVVGHFSRIEAIIVDLHVEAEALGLMDRAEYQATVRRIAESGRLEMALLTRYAVSRRRLDLDKFLKGWIN